MEWHEDVLDFWFLSDGDGAEQKKQFGTKSEGVLKQSKVSKEKRGQTATVPI